MSEKQWWGNERIQELLAGPFYGFALASWGRAVEVDGELRRANHFAVRYQGKYIICSGPRITEVLAVVLTEEERALKVYTGRNLATCMASVLHSEIEGVEKRKADGAGDADGMWENPDPLREGEEGQRREPRQPVGPPPAPSSRELWALQGHRLPGDE